MQTNIYQYTGKKSNGSASSSKNGAPSIPSSVGGSKRNAPSKRKKVDDEEEEHYHQEEEDEDEPVWDMEDEEEAPKKKKTTKKTTTKKAPTKKKKNSNNSDGEEDEDEGGVRTSKFAKINQKKKKEKNEVRYAFLENRLDSSRRKEGDVDFDNSTLFISSTDYSQLTPFEKQYWDIKKNHMDKIVFFKKGKFYELYENGKFSLPHVH